MKYLLKIYQPGVDAIEFPIELEHTKYSIGRSSDNDIAIRDSKVSRRHATFYFRGKQLVLKDENSSHGVMVNGKKITEIPVIPGDRIFIGETSFEIHEIKSSKEKKKALFSGLFKSKTKKVKKERINKVSPKKKNGLSILKLFVLSVLVVGALVGFKYHKLIMNMIYDTSFERAELAFSHLEKGQLEEAKVIFEELISEIPDVPDFHMGLGLANKGLGDFNNSNKAFIKASELAPNLYDAYYHLGENYIAMRDYEKGIPTIIKAIEIDRTDAEAHFFLCVAYFEIDNLVKAELECNMALELDPAHPDAKGLVEEIGSRRGVTKEEISDEDLTF
ncbi:MAG: FHA domain-containing protein [Pseudomonadota bacterium]